MEARILARFDEEKKKYGIAFDAKPEQIKIVECLTNGRNCLGLLPTGFGKTLSFVINSIISESPSITLIVSPLISLMDNQMETLTKWGLTCAKIASDTSIEVRKGIGNGDYTFVFSSPESMLKAVWREIMLSDTWQAMLKCIVIDEAHCLSEWGEDFRPDYKELHQLRSFFKVPILALTATSTEKIKSDIMASLHLDSENTDIVSKSPNRENIYICCQKKASNEYEKELSWLMEHIRSQGKNSKKTIIYCRSIDMVSEIFITLKQSLGKKAYVSEIENSDNLLIEMFHKCTHEVSKGRILSDFSKTNGTIRVVVATVALGMGIDIKDIDLVVHIGCPKSVISYWQEAGRCARDGRAGFSFILYDKFTASLKTTEKTMKEIVINDPGKCLRNQIMEHFSATESESSSRRKCEGCNSPICRCQSCKCCSVCSTKCPCSETKPFTVEVFLACRE